MRLRIYEQVERRDDVILRLVDNDNGTLNLCASVERDLGFKLDSYRKIIVA